MKIKKWHSTHIVEDSDIPGAIAGGYSYDGSGQLELLQSRIDHLQDLIMMLLEDCTDRKLADIASRLGFDVVEK